MTQAHWQQQGEAAAGQTTAPAATYYHPAHDPASQAPGAGGDASAAPARGSRLVGGLGAAVSLALIVGLGVWGYRLAVRDVTGVPVVRAVEGPMRVQPENPGGLATAHQGFSVNDIQAEGPAADAADRLALAPRPVELDAGDVPAETQAEVAAADPAPAAPASVDSAPGDTLVVAGLETGAGAGPDGETVLTEVTDTAAPMPLSEADVNAAVIAAVMAEQIIPASVPGVAVSPRPGHRPAGFAQTLASARAAQPQVAGGVSDDDATGPVAAAAPANAREVAAEDVPVGTRLVQLGAYESADVARDEWAKLAVQFEDYLEGKTRVVMQASSGGKTFYRLRAMGFEDLAEARRLCAVLMASRAACIPVVTR